MYQQCFFFVRLNTFHFHCLRQSIGGVEERGNGQQSTVEPRQGPTAKEAQAPARQQQVREASHQQSQTERTQAQTQSRQRNIGERVGSKSARLRKR